MVRLVEDGLENPACCVLRALNELSRQFLILSSDLTKFTYYAKAMTPSEAKQVWYDLFAKKGRLAKSIADLESRIGLPESILSDLRSFREEATVNYSEAVHHPFVSTVIRAYAGDFESDEDLHFALFGKSSPASKSILNDLNMILMYTLNMFLKILIQVHGFKTNVENRRWRDIFLLSQSIRVVNGA